jgi:hypothetical protein
MNSSVSTPNSSAFWLSEPVPPTFSSRISDSQWRLKYWTAHSCFSAAARVLNVPRFFRLPVFASVFFEYSLYSPLGNLRIVRLRIDRSGKISFR